MADTETTENQSPLKAFSRWGSVYLITNMVNGKQYVGQTRRTVRSRFLAHQHGDKSIVDHAIRKYGLVNFSVTEIYVAFDNNELNSAEVALIELYKTISPSSYNLQSGGGVLRSFHPITRAKLSASLKGRQFSEEHKKRLSIANAGRPLSDKTISAFQKANKERVFTEEYRLAVSQRVAVIPLSTYHRKRISRGQPVGRTGIRGVCYDGKKYIAHFTFEGRNYYVGRYDSIGEATFERNMALEKPMQFLSKKRPSKQKKRLLPREESLENEQRT